MRPWALGQPQAQRPFLLSLSLVHMQATNKELVIVSRIGVVFWAIVMGVAQTVVYKAK